MSNAAFIPSALLSYRKTAVWELNVPWRNKGASLCLPLGPGYFPFITSTGIPCHYIYSFVFQKQNKHGFARGYNPYYTTIYIQYPVLEKSLKWRI